MNKKLGWGEMGYWTSAPFKSTVGEEGREGKAKGARWAGDEQWTTQGSRERRANFPIWSASSLEGRNRLRAGHQGTQRDIRCPPDRRIGVNDNGLWPVTLSSPHAVVTFVVQTSTACTALVPVRCCVSNYNRAHWHSRPPVKPPGTVRVVSATPITGMLARH